MKGILTDLATPDQLEIVHLVGDVAPTLPESTGAEESTGVSESRDRARAALVESGLWTIGVDDAVGGGGASLDLRQVALAALGGHDAAMAWAIVQVDAAAEVLAAEERLSDELRSILAGEVAAVVLDLDDPRVDLAWDDGEVTGRIGRIDLASDTAVLVLLRESEAVVVRPDALRYGPSTPTTGMSGVNTVAATISAGPDQLVRVPTDTIPAIRARLHLGAAAIAAGIASEAADRAAAYAADRVQFGAPITALPTVRASLASQRSRALRALGAVVLDHPPAPDHAAAILQTNCRHAVATSADAVMVHGGYGYLHEYGVERLVRDAVSLRAAAGALGASRRIAERFAPR